MTYSIAFLLLIGIVCLICWVVLTLVPAKYLNPEKPARARQQPDPSESDFLFSDDAEHMRSQLSQLARDVIYFPTAPETMRSDRSLSFFGGLPIAPSSLRWPHNAETGFYYAFMGQLDVSDLSETDLTAVFPASGVLFFFLSDQPETTGKVLFHPDPDKDWVEIPQPDSVEHEWFLAARSEGNADENNKVFPKLKVVPTQTLDFPSVSDLHYGLLRTDGQTREREVLCEAQSSSLNLSAIETAVPSRTSRRHHCHKIGGFPNQVQGHHYENDFDHYLLLELGDDSNLHWAFDCIYQFWIKNDDLKLHRWEEVFATHDGS